MSKAAARIAKSKSKNTMLAQMSATAEPIKEIASLADLKKGKIQCSQQVSKSKAKALQKELNKQEIKPVPEKKEKPKTEKPKIEKPKIKVV